MKVIETATLRPGLLSHHDALQVYNGLDCALTVEILEEVSGPNSANIKKAAQVVYDFERAMQAPALEMMLRGWRIDVFQRDVEVARLRREKIKLQKILDELVCILWTGGSSPLAKSKRKADQIPGLNTASPKQMKEFFYVWLKIPEQYNYAKGQKTVTTNREALENCENYYHARIFVNLILAIRDRSKKISVLTSEVDPDLRMRTSYNVTGTETGRWSASKNVYDGGTNLQNITEDLRRIFISDPGKKLAYIDKSQAESRVLGWLIFILFGDSTYLDACESGDLHTIVCKLIWPELKWTGDPAEDKAVAEQKFYLHYSYRDMAKRGGHGTNYYGTARTMAKHLKVREELIARFQAGYFAAFPGIRKYHQWVATQIQTKQYLETPLGMGRHFFGRPGDDTTLREGIAFIPQSVVGQLLNLALWRNWRHMPHVDRLGQIHDAIVIQYPEEDEAKIIPQAVELMPTPLYHEGRKFTIPSDVMVGWNWAKQKKDKKTGAIINPDGLISWAGHDARKRQFDPTSSGLDRLIT
jgi:DNA polymerase-1